MAAPNPADPVRRLAAILWSDRAALEAALERLADLWGPIDHAGADRAFDVTDYYAEEMGAPIFRRIVTFRDLARSEDLADWKLAANAVEEAVAAGGPRRVNIDAGYLDHHKLVLASAKAAGHKVHLGRGIWADVLLRFHKGRFSPFEWTFADFRDGRYDAELSAIRSRYLQALRASGRAE